MGTLTPELEISKDTVVETINKVIKKHSLDKHTRILNDLYKDKLNFYFSLPHFVEIVHKNATKRNALQDLALKFNIKREEIIAIGDNFNDMDMIQYAGLGVAMGNAPKYLKEVAHLLPILMMKMESDTYLERFVLK